MTQRRRCYGIALMRQQHKPLLYLALAKYDLFYLNQVLYNFITPIILKGIETTGNALAELYTFKLKTCLALSQIYNDHCQSPFWHVVK